MTMAMAKILECLREEPMRLEQLCRRTGAKRADLTTTCAALERLHRIKLDDESFYHLNTNTVH